jgi:hypothetical protein
MGEIPYQYRNYNEYQNKNCISMIELEGMYQLLKICSPQTIQNELYFIKVEKGSKSFDGYGNNFFKIICHRDIFALGLNQSEITILSSRRYSSIKIMFFQNRWVTQNYYQPIKELEADIYNHFNPQRDNSQCCCLLLKFFTLLFLFILFYHLFH